MSRPSRWQVRNNLLIDMVRYGSGYNRLDLKSSVPALYLARGSESHPHRFAGMVE